MEYCPTCNLQYKRINKYSHELTKTHILQQITNNIVNNVKEF